MFESIQIQTVATPTTIDNSKQSCITGKNRRQRYHKIDLLLQSVDTAISRIVLVYKRLS